MRNTTGLWLACVTKACQPDSSCHRYSPAVAPACSCTGRPCPSAGHCPNWQPVVSADGSGASPVAVDEAADDPVCAPAGSTAPTPIAAVPHTAAMAITRLRFIVVPPLVV